MYEIQHFVQEKENFPKGANVLKGGMGKMASQSNARRTKLNEPKGIYAQTQVSSAAAESVRQDIRLLK